jgi:ABC-type glycerol-3-phosphate transport system substrate-binding protein
MSMNNSWFSWFWSMWGNNCDVLLPPYERDNAKLAAAGWKSGMTDPCMQQTVEYWWDAINTHKIVPRGMPAYDRNEANAVFMSGDAAFTVADSLWWGTFNDPAKSKIAGKVAATRFPLGPNRAKPFAWDDIWGWAIPKSIAPERKKLAKEMLEAMMLDKEGQKKLFKATGAPPPNTEFWAEIAAEDSFMKLLKESVLDSPDKVRGAYYFPQWPAVHKAFNDTVTKGRHRQARGHRKGAGRGCAAGQQGRAIARTRSPPRKSRRAFLKQASSSVTAGQWQRSHSASSTSIMARCSTP